ncbi:MAG TPA: outer membrane beta-barrel protein [Mariprofundaceae bacterium]|nr:outer membrane beta-barrel protein [Mariprofundaceae bacterium]
MKKTILAIAMVAAFVPAAAADGLYVAVDVGQSNANDMCSPANFGGNTTCSTTATAFRIGGGYNFTPNFGVEISYADLGNVNPVSSPGYYQSTKAKTYQVAATGTLPIGYELSLIGKLGLAQTTFDQSWTTAGLCAGGCSTTATDTNFAYGVGLQYDLQNFAIRMQYEDLGQVGSLPITATGGTGRSRVTLVSGGLLYRF